MRYCLATLVVVFVAVAHGADNTPKVTAIMEGKPVKFSEKVVPEGVKAAVGLLESCCDESLFDNDELKKALNGDHVRWVFPKPITAQVLNEKIEFTELVFRLPRNTGVFWVGSGDKWRRYTKYQIEKEKPFAAWLREAERPN
jgi:hypothetical protein